MCLSSINDNLLVVENLNISEFVRNLKLIKNFDNVIFIVYKLKSHLFVVIGDHRIPKIDDIHVLHINTGIDIVRVDKGVYNKDGKSTCL